MRNGFWVEVLRNVNQEEWNWAPTKAATDPAEHQQVSRVPRTKLRLFRLKLQSVQRDIRPKQGNSEYVEVQESEVVIYVLGSIFASEISTIAFAITAGIWQRVFWLVGYLCVPLVLKLLALVVNVRREGLIKPPTISAGNATRQIPTPITQAPPPEQIYEIVNNDLGIALISTSSPTPDILLQFFRHYGHPQRTLPSDRAREICCMLLIYVFVLYFPAGLVALLWMEPETQYLWLGYQVYTIVAMHVARLGGFNGCGRTEERIARILESKRSVLLRAGKSNHCVLASLEMEEIGSVADGKARVEGILRGE